MKTSSSNPTKTTTSPNPTNTKITPETPSPKAKKPKKFLRPLLAIIIALLLIIATAVATYFITKNTSPASNTDATDTADTANTSASDFDLVAQLDGRMDIFSLTPSYGAPVFISELYNDDLSDDGKLYFTLASLQNDFTTASAEETIAFSIKSHGEDYANAEIQFIESGEIRYKKLPVSAVTQRYHDLFNQNFKDNSFIIAADSDQSAVANIGGCGGFGYGPSEKIFIYGYMDGCGGLVPSIGSYRYDYKIEDDKAYAYVAAGTYSVFGGNCDDDIIISFEVIKITHEGHSLSDNYKCKSDYYSAHDYYNFVHIDNYQDFAKYRFEFTRSDNSLYFSRVTKL